MRFETIVAALVATMSAAIAFVIAWASFGAIGGVAGLYAGNLWQEPAVIAGLTFVFAYLSVTLAAPWLWAPQRMTVRFVQGAVCSMAVLVAVLASYGALKQPAFHGASFGTLTEVTLRFGGWVIPVVSGALAVALEAFRRTAMQRQ